MYIVLQPHSLTNPSDKYRVVDNQRWVEVYQGDKVTCGTVFEHADYAEAIAVSNRLNYAGSGT